MTCIKKWVLSEPLVDPIDAHDVLTNNKLFYDIDLEKVKHFFIKGKKIGPVVQQHVLVIGSG
jgi:hypothetical protein